MSDDVIRAAGAVLWRPAEHGVEVALVHRPRYDDWSLPKGKLEKGEHPLEGAVREVREETGQTGIVGRRLPTIEYDYGLGPKTVDYWAMRWSSGADFEAGEETDRLDWLPLDEALTRISYDRDESVLKTFGTATADGLVLLVRHAHAGKADTWDGDDDRLRPLDEHGTEQADRLAHVLPLFGPARILSAGKLRCTQTVAPLSLVLGVPVEVDVRLDEEDYQDDPPATLALLRELGSADLGTAVACSQGGAIPDAVARLCADADLPQSDVRAKKGSLWALSYRDGRLIAADYYPTF